MLKMQMNCLPRGMISYLRSRRGRPTGRIPQRRAELARDGPTQRLTAALSVLLAATCASGQQGSSTAHQKQDPVVWNGNKIVSRVLPEPDFVSLFIRLPIAHAAAKGQGVKVAVI